MSTSEILALLATGVVGLLGYFFKSAVNSVNSRLDKLEEKLSLIVAQMAASSAKQDHNAYEIERIRDVLHKVTNEVQRIKAIQDRCSSCNS
jgi:chromosome segregation ATPase